MQEATCGEITLSGCTRGGSCGEATCEARRRPSEATDGVRRAVVQPFRSGPTGARARSQERASARPRSHRTAPFPWRDRPSRGAWRRGRLGAWREQTAHMTIASNELYESTNRDRFPIAMDRRRRRSIPSPIRDRLPRVDPSRGRRGRDKRWPARERCSRGSSSRVRFSRCLRRGPRVRSGRP